MRGVLGACLRGGARLRGKRSKLRYLWLSHAFERAGRRGSIGQNLRILGDLSLELGDRGPFVTMCNWAVMACCALATDLRSTKAAS